ncbi:maleylpyruvate isomerase N-terminal domain-containing protein [Nocardia sp. NEAU-G5]|uniref:Maleylpyruvate isomerase N-terminal domain-containing protein n=1 Tax=Nocardia albiluteola TaxID=2842303 RepID=A0ABS6BBY3_9NOCA|nr:maleylpyruvate isomerase N-terminal domain-containing protein [Nocardia albiluteola]MBU3067790.1 maleylpyruvate isomerase N-terminal domain-containing protein [Nocardia albiluteola]
MTADHHRLREAITEELDRIDRIAAQLWDGDCDFTADSGHPGWSFGHVAAHIARGSDFLAGVLLTLSSGSDELRNNALERSDEIDREATRPGAVIITDFEQAAHRFAHSIDTVPEDRWSSTRVATGRISASVEDIIEIWLQEMRIHVPALTLGHEQDSRAPRSQCLITDFLPETAHPPRPAGGDRP